MTHIFVGGDVNALIINGLLRRLSLSAPVPVISHHNDLNPKFKKSLGEIYSAARMHSDTCIIVFDQDAGNIADHPERDLFVGDKPANVTWCAAIPVVEAWLFADEDALAQIVPPSSKELLSRWPSPETIPYPKMVRHYLLRSRGQIEEVFNHYDLTRAAARSPSLANFLRTVQISEHMDVSFESVKVGSRQIDKDIVRGLISEVFPADSTIFRTSSGSSITAEQMMREVAMGTEIGGEYATAILRVARDFLKRQAERERQFKPK